MVRMAKHVLSTGDTNTSKNKDNSCPQEDYIRIREDYTQEIAEKEEGEEKQKVPTYMGGSIVEKLVKSEEQRGKQRGMADLSLFLSSGKDHKGHLVQYSHLTDGETEA